MIICNLYRSSPLPDAQYRGQLVDDGVVVWQGPWRRREQDARLDANMGAERYYRDKQRHDIHRKRIIGTAWPVERN